MTRDQYLNKRKSLIDEAQKFLDEGNIDSYKAKASEVQELDKNYENAAREQANLNALGDSAIGIPVISDGKMNNKTSYENAAEMYNSKEYREAFMRNVLSGEAIPAKFRNAASQTTTGDVTTVIPTVLVQKIVEKLDNYGAFVQLATHTHYPAGVKVPTADINLVAEWVGERKGTDDQSSATSSVEFTYHKLRCVVAVSLEVSVVTLDIFETTLVNAVTKAMIKAKEKAMFIGDNNGPDGILSTEPAKGQTITIESGKHITYADLVSMEAALPEEYEDGAVWFMPKKTYYTEIVGMVDADGQPIARTNVGLDGKPEYTIFGRKVLFCKHLPVFPTTVTEATAVVGIFDFSHYCFNENYAMTLKRYTDEDTDDIKTKALMIADGKVIDKNSLVLMKVTALSDG